MSEHEVDADIDIDVDTDVEMRFLWMNSCSDHPLIGLAIYNGNKVLFECEHDGDRFSVVKSEFPLNNNNQLWHMLSADIAEFINNNLDHDHDVKVDIGCWTITIYEDVVSFQRHITYKLYDFDGEIGQDILKQYEKQHEMFQMTVGYHMDFDPNIQKLKGDKRSNDYFTYCANNPFNIMDHIDKLKYITTVKYTDFQKWIISK